MGGPKNEDTIWWLTPLQCLQQFAWFLLKKLTSIFLYIYLFIFSVSAKNSHKSITAF